MEKTQIQGRLKKITQPNDALAGSVVTIPVDRFTERIEKCGKFEEDVVESQKRNIKTEYKITIKDNRVLEPPDMFDFAVLSACISEMSAGNDCATVDRIYRALTGGKAHGGTRMTPGMKSAILASVEKLMSTLIKVDATQTAAKMKYPDMRKKIVSAILPAAYEVRSVNGQEVTTIHFYKDSPLAIHARAKNQMLTYDTRLLDVPNLRHTPRIIALKFYLIERVMEIFGRNMTPTITFANVFEKCGLADAAKWQKQDARRTIEAVMNHLKAEGVIDDFRPEREGNEYRAIKIRYTKPSQKSMSENSEPLKLIMGGLQNISYLAPEHKLLSSRT